MSLACEVKIDVQKELALYFKISHKPTPVLEYLKAISSLIGASHIIAVLEENENLKVYFDDKKYMDILFKNSLHVLGRHISVEYVVPPGEKVILSNIDPVVSNHTLIRLLSMFGTIVSPIICPPISDDTEFCHIGYGVRYCYMILYEPIPPKLLFKCDRDPVYAIKVKIGDEPDQLPFIKTDTSDMNETVYAITDDDNSYLSNDINLNQRDTVDRDLANDNNLNERDIVDRDLANDNNINESDTVDKDTTIPVLISVESNVSEFNSNLKPAMPKLPIQRSYVRRRGRPQTLKMKRPKMSATATAAKKIKKNVKHKWMESKRMRNFRKCKRTSKKTVKLIKEPSPRPTLFSSSPSSSSDVDGSPVTFMKISEKELSVGPLSSKNLLAFIKECKHNRAPIELAKKFLESDSIDLIRSLINQVEIYAKNSKHLSLKLRLGRVCKSISDSLNTTKS